PFHSIGRKNGLLAAVELPQIQLEEGEERMVLKKAVVALSEENIAQKGNYQMILHPEHVRQEE
ncbi:MAG: sigma-E processing peptidase SpoIIGA, partial [Lachnospiraceae bacterium]|nr:sigma-E processing peptidase SpoIIGA [Lachnospiraceae bacterium]